MIDVRRVISAENPSSGAPCEWLVENGLGGYASATITGAITRRYHGFLIAAQPAPLGRIGGPRRSRRRHRARRRQRRECAGERSISRFYVEHGSAKLAI